MPISSQNLLTSLMTTDLFKYSIKSTKIIQASLAFVSATRLHLCHDLHDDARNLMKIVFSQLKTVLYLLLEILGKLGIFSREILEFTFIQVFFVTF